MAASQEWYYELYAVYRYTVFLHKRNATDCWSVKMKQPNLQKMPNMHFQLVLWVLLTVPPLLKTLNSRQIPKLWPCSRAFQMYSWVVLPTFTKSACEKNARKLGQWMLPGWNVSVSLYLTSIFLIITVSRGNHGLQSIKQTDFGDQLNVPVVPPWGWHLWL